MSDTSEYASLYQQRVAEGRHPTTGRRIGERPKVIDAEEKQRRANVMTFIRNERAAGREPTFATTAERVDAEQIEREILIEEMGKPALFEQQRRDADVASLDMLNRGFAEQREAPAVEPEPAIVTFDAADRKLRAELNLADDADITADELLAAGMRRSPRQRARR